VRRRSRTRWSPGSVFANGEVESAVDGGAGGAGSGGRRRGARRGGHKSVGNEERRATARNPICYDEAEMGGEEVRAKVRRNLLEKRREEEDRSEAVHAV
jgi:hypothetical protein